MKRSTAPQKDTQRDHKFALLKRLQRAKRDSVQQAQGHDSDQEGKDSNDQPSGASKRNTHEHRHHHHHHQDDSDKMADELKPAPLLKPVKQNPVPRREAPTNPLLASINKSAKIRRERDDQVKERKRQAEQKNKEIQQHKKDREDKRKLYNSRTNRGQPKLGLLVSSLVQKIEKGK